MPISSLALTAKQDSSWNDEIPRGNMRKEIPRWGDGCGDAAVRKLRRILFRDIKLSHLHDW